MAATSEIMQIITKITKGLSSEEKSIILNNDKKFTQEFIDQILFEKLHDEAEAKHEAVNLDIGFFDFVASDTASKIAWIAKIKNCNVEEACNKFRQGLKDVEILSSAITDALNNMPSEEREEILKNQHDYMRKVLETAYKETEQEQDKEHIEYDVSSAITSNLQNIISEHGERLMEINMSKLKADVASIGDSC